jgi:hypothetical protein
MPALGIVSFIHSDRVCLETNLKGGIVEGAKISKIDDHTI